MSDLTEDFLGIFTKEFAKEFIESLLIAGVLAFFIITFVVQSFVVSGSSMEPTLHNGDRLFVNKFIYYFHSPERGDVVVLEPKADERDYIKRVIGLPGDKVEIINGSVYVNGYKIRENYIKDEPIETSVYAHEDPKTGKTVFEDTSGPYQVPKNHVFVMGDNRNHSLDSRIVHKVGYVSYDRIKGKAFWVYWPVTEIRILDNPTYPKLSS